ncbi:hypothetical protein N302_11078, partial [Corvus brachyrhynchos]
KEQQRKKAASLRRFQGEAERESCVAVQYSTPWKNTCLFQSLPAPTIIPAQLEEKHGEPFQQQAAELSRAVKQVRRRLASRRTRTVFPGAWRLEVEIVIWVSRRNKPEPCLAAAVPMDKSEELLLAGHHDLPAELLEQGTAAHGTGQDDDFYVKIEFKKVCDGLVKDSSLPEPPGRPHTEYQPPIKLWAGVDQEETRKQVSSMVSQLWGKATSWGPARNGDWDGEARSLSTCVSAGLRGRRRICAGKRSRGCKTWLSRENSPQEKEPGKPWPSFSWRRGE